MRRVGMDVVDVNNLIPIDHDPVPLLRVSVRPCRRATSAFVKRCPVGITILQLTDRRQRHGASPGDRSPPSFAPFQAMRASAALMIIAASRGARSAVCMVQRQPAETGFAPR
jgi:hypothetical protein